MPPKRKATSSPKKPSKKTRTEVSDVTIRHSTRNRSVTTGSSTKSNHSIKHMPDTNTDDVGAKTAPRPMQDEDHIWEILDNDSPDPILVGNPAPHRLTLRFRHRVTMKVESYTYPKKKAEEIDWNSKEDVEDINKWRRQVFRRGKGFSAKVTKLPWAPYERAYLEIA